MPGALYQLLVSVITVRRAYEELEREGIIYRRVGSGTLVAAAGHDLTRAGLRASEISYHAWGTVAERSIL